eukprot:SM000708S21257  [mRNA]  locus=s708:111:1439:+ [translate_table: standard]
MDEDDLQYGRLDPATAAGAGVRKKRKRPRTEQLLAKAAAIQEQLARAKESEDGKEQARKHAWSAALGRATGEKVLDDPKLLKRSLKRQAKAKEKSAKQWAGRHATQSKEQAARQSARREHLQQRADDHRQHRIEKREKKLLRPGFEGRKAGFINAAAAPAAATASGRPH